MSFAKSAPRSKLVIFDGLSELLGGSLTPLRGALQFSREAAPNWQKGTEVGGFVTTFLDLTCAVSCFSDLYNFPRFASFGALTSGLIGAIVSVAH